MDFRPNDNQRMLKDAARAFFDDRFPPAEARRLYDTDCAQQVPLWNELAEMGWLGLAIEEEHGGSGLHLLEAAALQQELGYAAFPSPLLGTFLVSMAIQQFGTQRQRDRYLPKIASGRLRCAIALTDRELDVDIASLSSGATRRGEDWLLDGLKPFVAWGVQADLLLVPANGVDGPRWFLVHAQGEGVRIESVAQLDLSTPLAELRLTAAPISNADTFAPDGGRMWRKLIQWSGVLAAAEMAGAARRCLEMTVDYAGKREQFGRLIGSFQAVRHMCADMLVETENAECAVLYAAWAIDADAADSQLASSVAKAYISHAATRIWTNAIQVHGGIGYTWEYDLQFYVKRLQSLQCLYGDACFHAEAVFRAISDERKEAQHA